MAQSGNWVPNLINWIIGYFIGVIWIYIGYVLSIFGMWQVSADSVLSALDQFKMPDVTGSAYKKSLTVSK